MVPDPGTKAACAAVNEVLLTSWHWKSWHKQSSICPAGRHADDWVVGLQVGTAVLNTGEKLQCDLCLVGVGARPNLELFKDHLDMLDDKPGGVKAKPILFLAAPEAAQLCWTCAYDTCWASQVEGAYQMVLAGHAWGHASP